MKWFLKVLKHYADFSGRASRQEFWMFVLFNFLFSLAYGIIVVGISYLLFSIFPLFEKGGEFMVKLSLIYYCIMIIPSMAVLVRRLHDTGKSGWMILVSLIPFVGGIWLFVLSVLPGNPGSNKYGSVPESIVSNEPKPTLKQKTLNWVTALTFFSLMLGFMHVSHMITERSYLFEDPTYTFDFIFRQFSSILFDIALIVMGIGLWQKKDYSRTISVWIFIGFLSSLVFQIYTIIPTEVRSYTGSLFFPALWILTLVAFIIYGGFLFIRKGKELLAAYTLIGGSTCWIIMIIFQHIQTIPMVISHGNIDPAYFLNFLFVILPISFLIYGLEIRKESILIG